jgi:predicted enzyme related to lactoylglutathione lyase
MAKVMFEKVAFTMFWVEDATRARAFYEKTLGLTRGMSSPGGNWTEYDLPGGGCLALFMHPDPTARQKPGGATIALEVADLDALDEDLKGKGVDYRGPRIKGPHCQMQNIVDSEGNAIILHQLDGKKRATSSAKPAGTTPRSRTRRAPARKPPARRTPRSTR